MIHVQHLLGVGHLQRSLQLASAIARSGFAVDLVSGGMPLQEVDLPGVSFHQLPPARCADASFSCLLDADGNEVDDAWKQSRRRQLLDLFERLSPSILITETFPFGRRMLRFELLPLLEKARASARCQLVISSIRDILQPKSKPGRNQEISELIERYYDRVLVHGDPAIARLEHSFPQAAKIADKLYYSGYICRSDNATSAGHDSRGEVLVSAGGSDTGRKILQTAIAARPLSRLKHNKWRILVSPAIDESAFEQLRQLAGEGIEVERNRPDFPQLMRHASLSISQAGYNTLTDVFAAGAAAVVIPFAESGEIEQSLRAQRLQACGRVVMLEQTQLSAQNLAAAIDRAIDLDASMPLNLNGADNSADRIAAWLRAAQT